VLERPEGDWRGSAVTGYVIHHGRVDVHGGDRFLDGTRSGAVWGTLWHGALENDEFRRAWLAEVASQAGRSDWAPRPDTSFGSLRTARLDLLADAVEEHLDTGALRALLERGAPAGLPFVAPGAPGLNETTL
jgi:adenosylcobyric acid synthase